MAIASRDGYSTRDYISRDYISRRVFKVNCWPGHTIEDYFLCLNPGVNVHCTDIPLAVLKVKDKLQ